MHILLSAKDFSKFSGIKLRTVQDRLAKGKISSNPFIGKSNKTEYGIPISELTEAQ